MTNAELTTLLDQAEELTIVQFNHEEALQQFNTVLQYLDGTVSREGSLRIRSRALVWKCQTLWRLGRNEEAQEFATTALAVALQSNYREMEAKALGLIGTFHMTNRDYVQALAHMNKALALYEVLGNKAGQGRTLSNIGNIYANILLDFATGLEYFIRALSILESVKSEKESVAITTEKIGGVYFNLGYYDKALEYQFKTQQLYIELGHTRKISSINEDIGFTYFYLRSFENAMEFYGKALVDFEAVHDQSGVARIYANMGQIYKDTGAYEISLEYFGKAVSIHEALNDDFQISYALGCIGELYSDPAFDGYSAEKAEEYLLRSIALLQSHEGDGKIWAYPKYLLLAKLYKQEEQWKLHSEYYVKYHEAKDEIQNEAGKQQVQKHEMERSFAVERALAEATNEILTNILPPNITKRLLNGEKKIADTYDSVSVLFVDIVGFTKLSALLPAYELIDLLDIIFTRFDTICKKHGLEKIKTIGDAYMAVCGAPVLCDNHAECAAYAALEMLEDWELDRQFSIEIDLDFRIGVHTGSVVAGIIGENKYSYDLWGDAVNTASRMESHGEAGKVHVSEEFKQALQDGPGLSQASPMSPMSLRFVERGELDIKGKGMMKTYFIEKADR
ncbi:MAG: tetratricopeptide repeat protein [Ignavibacteria bacterium]|nr:tetratricopeptide repeat protein [Ignavibacteria bacterium]